ncbi:MAG: DUF3857 domain-containing protein [Bacteroidia bacterium]|nr:DUF3857 domain-containing protein [Bacteroidia bacterium]
MNFFRVFVVFLIAMPLQGMAQDFSLEFGRISSQELNMAHYEKDPTADAVVLSDIGKSYFIESESSFDVIFERSTRIKIFSEAGLKWADVEIMFYQEGGIYERVYDIEAITYNLEGGQLSQIPLKSSNFYDEKINEYWNVKKFALPDVKPGSIIEYRYKISSQYKFNLRDWEFQWRIPVIYSEYEVKMIPFFEYSWLLQGATKFDSQTSTPDRGLPRQYGPTNFNDMIHKYIMKEVPAFNDEEYISSINDYIIKIDFQLAQVHTLSGATVNVMTTWPDMINDLVKQNEFGKYIEKSEKLLEKLMPLDHLATLSPEEKFDQVVQYVKGNYNWDKVNGKYASQSPNDFIKTKIGNSADLNLFLIGLLRAAGIEAQPVLISTRDHGKVLYDYAFTHFFNYVIVVANVDGKMILTDATEVLCPNNRIPLRCINDKGLLIEKGSISWVDLSIKFISSSDTKIAFDFTPSGLKAAVKTRFTEYDAWTHRRSYGEDTKKIREELEKRGYEAEESSILVTHARDIEHPYSLDYVLTGKPEIINEKIYLTPFLHEVLSENPLTQATRRYPVDMVYPTRKAWHSTIQIPEGYKIDFLPPNLSLKTDLYELEYTVVSSGSTVSILFVYYFKKAVYAPGEYAKIKYFFGEIVRKGQDKVVLAPG